jgi:hypothetical protein
MIGSIALIIGILLTFNHNILDTFLLRSGSSLALASLVLFA